MTDTHRKGMASGQLLEFIRNDQWPPDSSEPWTAMSGRDFGGLSQAPSTTQINHWWYGTACLRNWSTRLL